MMYCSILVLVHGNTGLDYCGGMCTAIGLRTIRPLSTNTGKNNRRPKRSKRSSCCFLFSGSCASVSISSRFSGRLRAPACPRFCVWFTEGTVSNSEQRAFQDCGLLYVSNTSSTAINNMAETNIATVSFIILYILTLD